MSPPVKLCAFGLLLVAMFLTARFAGASLGPVTTTYSRSGGTPARTGPGMPGMPGMNMFPSTGGTGSTRPSPASSTAPSEGKESR